MSMIGNQPGVSSQRTVLEEVVTGSPKSAFVPQAGYIKGYVDVLVNGIEIDATDFTAADGITVTLATAAAVGDTVKIKAWLPRGLSDGYLKSEADAKFAPLVNGNMILAPNAGGNRVIGFASGTDTTLVIQGGGTSGSGANLELTRDYLAYLDANTTTFRSVDGSALYAALAAAGLSVGMNMSGWGAGLKIIQSPGMSMWGSSGLGHLSTNTYYDGTNYKYLADGTAIDYYQYGGTHVFRASDTGTAGANVTTFVDLLSVAKGSTLALQGATRQTGAGITFLTAQNASSDPNTLDDYEEGTWSPFDSSVVTARGITIPCQAHYVKIGRMCHIWMRFGFSNTSSTSQIQGVLPFAGSNPTLNTGTSPFFITVFGNAYMAEGPGFCYNSGSDNAFALYKNNTNYASWAWNSGPTEITIIGSYRTAN